MSLKEITECQSLVYFDVTKLDKDSFIQSIQVFNKQYPIDQNLTLILTQVLKNLADACYHSFKAKSLNQFQNNLKFLNNLLINEMLTPFMHQGTELWVHFSFICMMSNEMLLHLRNKSFIENKNNNKKSDFEENKNNANKVEFPKLDDTLTKDFWFKQKKNIDVTTMANIMAYTVSCLFLEEKWQILIGLVRNFSNITSHCYSNNLLPFLIHAQTIKLDQAKSKTEVKKEELEKRIEDFKKWEVNLFNFSILVIIKL